MRQISLTPPVINADHIQEKIICIRAHRERIFRIEAGIEHAKLICHNYGQGGAGWTFLFGSVAKSIAQFEEQLSLYPAYKHKPICIIGAGCYGLLTAIQLAYKGYNVHIVAEDTDTTISSYKAAGFFFPRARKTATDYERAIFESVGIQSYLAYQDIIQDNHPFIQYGAYIVPAYYSPDIDPGFGPYRARGLMLEPVEVMVDFGNEKQYRLLQYQALWINSTEIMQQLHHQVATLSIPIKKISVTSFDDVEESIIFNCAGLGAKNLANDTRVIPVQGHLLLLKDQPPIEQLRYMINVKTVMTNQQGKQRDELIYFAPKHNGIIGITFIRGQDSPTNNQHEFDRLIQRCQDFFGSTSF